MTPQETFMQRLKELRRIYRYSQRELGSLIGAHTSAVSNYEAGRAMPDAEKLAQLAEIFHVSVDYLLGNYPADDPSSPSLQTPQSPPYTALRPIPLLTNLAQRLSAADFTEPPCQITLPAHLTGEDLYIAIYMPNNSLARLRIFCDDLLLVQCQSHVVSGDIAVAYHLDLGFCIGQICAEEDQDRCLLLIEPDLLLPLDQDICSTIGVVRRVVISTDRLLES